MDQEYSSYLSSDEWREKRKQRLEMSHNRCSACGSNQSMQVHHLTYERIFNEEMSDLVPLCDSCHDRIEAIIQAGKLSRKGNVLFLATETIRLLSFSAPVQKKKNKKHKKPKLKDVFSNRPIPSEEELFNRIPLNTCAKRDLVKRYGFKDAVKTMRHDEFKAFIRSSGLPDVQKSQAYIIFQQFQSLNTTRRRLLRKQQLARFSGSRGRYGA